jgi:hypothetical protein
MTAAQEKYKKSLIQKIQVSKGNVFADDEDRKAFMLSRFGVDSTTKMTIDQLKLLCDFCNRKVSEIPVAKASEAQLYKLSKLWGEKARDKSFIAFLSFINKITSLKVETAKQLTKYEAQKVIIALENMKP